MALTPPPRPTWNDHDDEDLDDEGKPDVEWFPIPEPLREAFEELEGS